MVLGILGGLVESLELGLLRLDEGSGVWIALQPHWTVRAEVVRLRVSPQTLQLVLGRNQDGTWGLESETEWEC